MLDEIPPPVVVPERLDDGKKLLGVPFVDLGVQLVVDKPFLGHPATLYHPLANHGGDAGEGVFDDTHAADADLQLIRYIYPSTNDGFDYDYNELIGKVGWNWATFMVGYSNDVFNSDESGIYYNAAGEWGLPGEFTLNAGIGYYDVSIEEWEDDCFWDCDVFEYYDDSSIGGFLGLGIELPLNRQLRLTGGARVHFVEFDGPTAVAPSGSLDGPIYVLSVGVGIYR